jgi:hypothetical protein
MSKINALTLFKQREKVTCVSVSVENCGHYLTAIRRIEKKCMVLTF